MKRAVFTEVTPQNILEETLFCIKDLQNPGFQCKSEWFNARYKEGLRLSILKDIKGKMIGFTEYLPASKAWRPIIADEYMFIHCMYIYSNKDKNLGYGSELIKYVEERAKLQNMAGVCIMTSKGPWMADMRVFRKNGYSIVDTKDRYELLSKKWNQEATEPSFKDWVAKREQYSGWHLLYADQCPWHEKSVQAIRKTADEFGIDLRVKKLESSEEAKNGPSGYGVFSLLYNGRLLEDHYLSATRFRNILEKELV